MLGTGDAGAAVPMATCAGECEQQVCKHGGVSRAQLGTFPCRASPGGSRAGCHP